MNNIAAFKKFSGEAAIIGRLLASYTDLEVGLMHCAQVVRDDFDIVLKVMFRTRGEIQRVYVADALGRHFYDAHQLGTELGMSSFTRRLLMGVIY
jgi:hypothetical protein